MDACSPGEDGRGSPGSLGASLLEVLAGERTAKLGNIVRAYRSKLPESLWRRGAWSEGGLIMSQGRGLEGWSDEILGAWSKMGGLLGVGGEALGGRWLKGSVELFRKVSLAPEGGERPEEEPLGQVFTETSGKGKTRTTATTWQGGKGIGPRVIGTGLPDEVDGMLGARGREDPERSILKALSTTSSPRSAAKDGLAPHPLQPRFPITGQ